MQTFLPYSDFRRTAAALDVRRLGKQRVETLQILRALTFEDYGWRNHPAVTMWNGYTEALVTYGDAIIQAWQAAGFSDTVRPQLHEFLVAEPLRTQRELKSLGRLPPWLGSRPLHRSHQAALVRKDPEHYRPLFPTVDAELPYVWPASSPPAATSGPVSAWVVRMDPAALAAGRTHDVVALRAVAGETSDAPFGTGRRSTKRRRQIAAFVAELEVGDRIVVPVGDRLAVAQVTGGYQWRTNLEEELRHTRPVSWVGELHRSDLVRPVHLQDPRVVFGLRAEPRVAT